MGVELDPWRIAETADYICSKGHTIVTAQFPDDLLKEAASICNALQAACGERGHPIQAYILADTTYNSLSVDEVAASHVNAHCVVHYGRASLTKLSRLPAFYVFPVHPLDCQAAANSLANSVFLQDAVTQSAQLVVFLDQVYLDSLPEFKTALESSLPSNAHLVFPNVATRQAEPEVPRSTQTCCGGGGGGGNASQEETCCSSGGTTQQDLAGYTWSLPSINSSEIQNLRFVWVGAGDAPALSQLQLTHSTAAWIAYDPTTGLLEEGIPLHVARTLKRRYFLVEKARNANIVGILVGTLGAAGYGDAVQRLRQAAQEAGKKTYTLLMGKPSPAKLANFPEIEVFVMVADPQGQILDCKDYLAPIITPHEAMIAFNPDGQWAEEGYRLDFDAVVGQGNNTLAATSSQEQTQEHPNEAESTKTSAESALVIQAQRALQITAAPSGGSHLMEVKSAADYLVHKRSWTGVETPLVGSESKEAAVAVKGSTGRAAGYTHESQNDPV